MYKATLVISQKEEAGPVSFEVLWDPEIAPYLDKDATMPTPHALMQYIFNTVLLPLAESRNPTTAVTSDTKH